MREATIEYPTHETVAEFLDAVRGPDPLMDLARSQLKLDRGLEAGKRWTVDRFGSTDVRLEDQIVKRWWIFDLERRRSEYV